MIIAIEVDMKNTQVQACDEKAADMRIPLEDMCCDIMEKQRTAPGKAAKEIRKR